jgi:transcriptional regulator GlxA family with amidase domain
MLPAPREAHDLPALPSKAPAALQATSKLIAADLAAPDPLGQAEALTGLSRRQLERLFRAHLRTSPARHLRALRLAKGRRLLRDTLWTVDRIARFVGFANQAHFCRLYRHRYGQSPHQVEAA